jgi:hypothetical protein
MSVLSAHSLQQGTYVSSCQAAQQRQDEHTCSTSMSMLTHFAAWAAATSILLASPALLLAHRSTLHMEPTLLANNQCPLLQAAMATLHQQMEQQQLQNLGLQQ